MFVIEDFGITRSNCWDRPLDVHSVTLTNVKLHSTSSLTAKISSTLTAKKVLTAKKSFDSEKKLWQRKKVNSDWQRNTLPPTSHILDCISSLNIAFTFQCKITEIESISDYIKIRDTLTRIRVSNAGTTQRRIFITQTKLLSWANNSRSHSLSNIQS